MRIAIAGSSGLIGQELVKSLRADGHEVLRLVRRPAATDSEVSWAPGQEDREQLRGVAAIVNLAGAGVGDHRWTAAYKREILESRTTTTRTLAQVAADFGIPVLVNASAIGWYGGANFEPLDESAPVGTGFLADVVHAWEAAAEPARAAGVRVAHPRTGLVISANGGAFGRMLPLFRFGLGGRMGNGRQYWSFISMRDEISALKWLIEHPISGPVNLTAPNPTTNAELTKTLARLLSRPALLPVPAVALRLVLGEFASEVLGSNRIVPRVLLESGFVFSDPDVESALRTLLTK